MNRSLRLARVAIGWNLVTILLGALVRATHSGAGCGRSWPVCQGEFVPQLDFRLLTPTAIEFTHRMASGIALILVGGLVVAIHRDPAAVRSARRAARVAAGAIVAEALIGAVIVLFEWVADDTSVARAVAVPLHLINTLLLLGALTLTAWFLMTGRRWPALAGAAARWIVIGAVALVLISASGAVTALADTLFPSEDLLAGLASDFSAAEHFLTRLRIVHPVLAAVSVVAALAAIRGRGLPAFRSARALVGLTLAQVVVGVGNVVLGTPLWLSLPHLLVADLIWISYVWLAAQVLSSSVDNSSADSTGARHRRPVHK